MNGCEFCVEMGETIGIAEIVGHIGLRGHHVFEQPLVGFGLPLIVGERALHDVKFIIERDFGHGIVMRLAKDREGRIEALLGFALAAQVAEGVRRIREHHGGVAARLHVADFAEPAERQIVDDQGARGVATAQDVAEFAGYGATR